MVAKVPDNGLNITDLAAADDFSLTSDGAVINFGADGEVTLTHVADAGLALSSAGNLDTLSLISTDADANAGPNLRLYRNSASPANSDVLGAIDFEGRNNNSQDVVYGTIKASLSDVTDGAEHGLMEFKSMVGGTNQLRMSFDDTSVIFNQDSIDSDFRVESNGNTHALFVNANDDVIGLFNSSPSFTTGSGIHLADDVKIGFGDGGSSRPDFQLSADSSNLGLACGFGADTADVNIATSGTISTGQETSPDTDGGGLCLNMGGSDNIFLSAKSSDVAHGRTSYAETDTYFTLTKAQAAGGAGITSYNATSSAYSLFLNGYASGEDTTKSTSGVGHVIVTARSASGTSFLSVGSNANMFVVQNASTTKFIVDAEGDIHYDGSASAYDSYNDAHLVRAFDQTMSPKEVIQSEFDKFVEYKKDDLVKAGLLGSVSQEKIDEGEKPLVCLTGMQRLHNGAIWQQYEKHHKLAEAVYEMAKEALGEDKADAILEKHDIKLLN